MRRVWDNGLPLDLRVRTRFINALVHLLPLSVVCSQFRKQVNARFDHELYGLQPSHEISASAVVVNDDLPSRILSGLVQVRPTIARLTSTTVQFTDGTCVDDVAAIVCATGMLVTTSQSRINVMPAVMQLVIDVTINYSIKNSTLSLCV